VAIKRKTGARGLRSIVEELLLNIMFEAPSIAGAKALTITGDIVRKAEPPSIAALMLVQKSA
jgi:ATP-dependent Clp protease ATP-binding subunit ClpX